MAKQETPEVKAEGFTGELTVETAARILFDEGVRYAKAEPEEENHDILTRCRYLAQVDSETEALTIEQEESLGRHFALKYLGLGYIRFGDTKATPFRATFIDNEYLRHQLEERFRLKIHTPDDAEVSTGELIFRELGHLVCTTLAEPPQE